MRSLLAGVALLATAAAVTMGLVGYGAYAFCCRIVDWLRGNRRAHPAVAVTAAAVAVFVAAALLDFDPARVAVTVLAAACLAIGVGWRRAHVRARVESRTGRRHAGRARMLARRSRDQAARVAEMRAELAALRRQHTDWSVWDRNTEHGLTEDEVAALDAAFDRVVAEFGPTADDDTWTAYLRTNLTSEFGDES
jgi:hypothetical protein